MKFEALKGEFLGEEIMKRKLTRPRLFKAEL